tara:strand:+ start:706 stop:903 length:198 start_codon:yes stop_codon:yes gene_type:complete
MKVKVYVDKLDEEKVLEVSSVLEIFSELELNRDSFIVVRDGELIMEDVSLNEGDSIKLLSVISGG